MAAQLTRPPFTFFNSNTTRTASAPSPSFADGRSASKRRLINIQAGLAELMLLNRLRARTRRDRGGETLERAARIIEVTSRHWFADTASLVEVEPEGLDAAQQLTAEAPALLDQPQR